MRPGAPRSTSPNVSPATWSLTGSLNVARYSPSAILLGNGTVLLAFGAQSMATEIYAPAGYGNRP